MSIPSKNSKTKRLFSLFLSIVIISLIIWYLAKNAEILVYLKNLKIGAILLIALLQPLCVVFGAVINKLLINEMGYPISLKDNILLQFVNNLLNKIIAEGGAVYRGGYLKTIYSLPVSKFFVSIGGGYIITLLVNSSIGLLFSLVIYFINDIFNIYVILLFALTVLITLVFIIFSPKFKNSGWFFDRVNRVLEGWDRIKRKPRLILSLSIFTFLIMIFQSLRIYVAYRGLGINIGLFNTILYNSLSTLSNFINFTPGSIGLTEGLLVFSSKVLGLSIDNILLGSLLLRAINLVSSVFFGLICYLILQINLHHHNNSD